MVHSSQVSNELSLSREDDDDMKVKAMDWVAPAGSQVRPSLQCCWIICLALMEWWLSVVIPSKCVPQVWIKVTEIKEEGNGSFKLACSMKVCPS